MRKLLFLAIMIVACGSLAFAQSTDRAKPEVFVGFSIDSIDAQINQSGVFVQNSGNRVTGYGFDTSVTGYFHKNVGIEGDFDGHFRRKTFNVSPTATGTFTAVDTKFNDFNFMAGPHVKFTTSNAKVSPFVHALIGGNHSKVSGSTTFTTISDSETDLALKLGGGIDFGMSDHVGVRVSGDYNPVFEKNNVNNGVTTSNNRTRSDAIFSVGLVFK
jgi:opacity protein-like surface antigen